MAPPAIGGEPAELVSRSRTLRSKRSVLPASSTCLAVVLDPMVEQLAPAEHGATIATAPGTTAPDAVSIAVTKNITHGITRPPCRYAACAALTSSTGCQARCPTPWAICWRQETPVAATSVAGALAAQRREQPGLADLHRQLVVLGLEPERPRHPAAAGVELRHLGARDALEQRDGRRRARQRLLVAVAVEDDRGRGRERPVAARSAPSSIASTSSSSTSRAWSATASRARVAGQQREVLLAQREQARRLAADDRHAALGARREPRRPSSAAIAARLVEQALGDARAPAAAARSRSRTRQPGRLQQLDRRAADRRAR